MTKTDTRRLSDEINAVLGTSINFTKLKRDDLIRLHQVLSQPRDLLLRLGLRTAQTRVRERVETTLFPLLEGLLHDEGAAEPAPHNPDGG